MAGAKSAEDIEGLEFDWLASDATGKVALFSTGGAGFAPSAFLRDTESHDSAIRTLMSQDARTNARFAPTLDPSKTNTWRMAAERGLYAYDCDPSGGPYVLVAAPMRALGLEEVGEQVGLVASRISLRLAFADSPSISGPELLEALE